MATIANGLKAQLGLKQNSDIKSNLTTRVVLLKTENTRSFLKFSEVLKLLKEPIVQQLRGIDWWAIPYPILSSLTPKVSPKSGLPDLGGGVIKWPTWAPQPVLQKAAVTSTFENFGRYL
eukprot:TRINITY_DN9278_c0_g2_i2.p2 TRINITY_DN9278_c0_g2~~TRINITY_DN9278_c0_g2_i2.p2  ORF type:complete len:119 (-),score=23.17 TRINITY_DN9278_c0_g2_i2:1133-1489(-)